MSPASTGGAPADRVPAGPVLMGSTAPDLALTTPASPTPIVPRPMAIRPVPTVELVERARITWRATLMAEAGDTALADIARLGDAILDLSAAHPSGLAQFLAGRTTRLSNLVREGSALSAAKRRARAVANRADEYAQRYGVASAFLAIGVATWTEDTPDGAGVPPVVVTPADANGETADVIVRAAPIPRRTVRAPVLLRPVTVLLCHGGSDPDLTLEPSLEVNPVLASALRAKGALLDPAELARGAFSPAGFDPLPGLDRLHGLGAAVLQDFRLDDRLLVGTFVHPEQSLVDDFDGLAPVLADHEVVAALAGDERAARALAQPVPPRRRGDRPLEEERGVGDLDPAQAHILDILSSGRHLLIDAPPGSDVATTVAAVVAESVAAGRTVLYVAGHRRAAEAVTSRLRALGLDEVVLDAAPQSGWRERTGQRLLGAMTVEPVPVDTDKVGVVEVELQDRRGRLRRYVAAMHQQREPWGASAYDALQALARMTSTRPGPQTHVRLTPPVAEALNAERRAQAANDLVHVATLGAFSPAIRSSAWYGANLPTPDRARAAMHRVERLLDIGVRHMRTEVARVADETGLEPAQTLGDWTEQVRMLAGVRVALDVFRPLVFEKSAADMVVATATQEWRDEHAIEMSGTMRRRLRKRAKDMLRPGRPVADLHAALGQVEEQREVWRTHCMAGGWPRIPDGLAGIEDDHRQVRDDIDALSVVLAGTAGGSDFDAMTWDTLEGRLTELSKDRETLGTLPERTALVRSLGQRGLGALLADLADRQVGVGLVTAELELAWWSTVFEQILTQDPALAGHNGKTLTRLVAEFRALDERFLVDRAVLARAATREAVHKRMRSVETETQELFAEIVGGGFTTMRQAVMRYPNITRHLRPCVVASPMIVPHLLPPGRTEDLVILDAAGQVPLHEVIPVLARGRQILVVGDTRCTGGSALGALMRVLPAVALEARVSRRDPHLTRFLADHGYGDRLHPTPLPLDAGLMRLELVDGAGMPAVNGLVEGTDAEVARVVELVAEHARTNPEQSLAVVTASPVHADRVRDAITTFAEDRTVARFLEADRPEPFAVVDVGATEGLQRDAIIFSVGFGRTPHGRVLHRFGTLTEDGGDARLLEALGTTRTRLTVVSCFGAGDLDSERLRSPGAVLLGDLLALAEKRTVVCGKGQRPAPHAGSDPDCLVLDLAERLWRRGLLVDVDHGCPGGDRIPLVVGHPDLPDRMLVAVLTDDDAYVGEPSVRVRDRQVPQRLEQLGWTVVQAWSATTFLDPEAEAQGVFEAVLEARARVAEEEAVALRSREASATTAEQVALVDAARTGRVITGPAPVVLSRGPRPSIEKGLPIGSYTDDQLDELVAWICSDGVGRDDQRLEVILRAELGTPRRGIRVDTAVGAAVRRRAQ